MSLNEHSISEETLNWVTSFIVKKNICPFAKKPVNTNRLRISVSLNKKKAPALEDLISEIQLLDNDPAIETTLLVFADGFRDFFSYLDFVDLAEQLLILQGYEGVYQLATFHPDYYFADSDPEDKANYTNRSPYPMLHLLREDMLEKAIAAYGDTDEIPQRNIKTLRQLSLDELKKYTQKLP